jgi:deoxyribose-phosphate aldolase
LTPSPEPYRYEDIAALIDHALLGPTLDAVALEAGIHLAMDYAVASVCIAPHYLARAHELLRGTGVRSTTTVGFPHGTTTTNAKLDEARHALTDGAEELDVVVNVGRVLGSDWDYVSEEVRALTDFTHARDAKIKVIFENSHLDEARKIRLCELCGTLGVDWVKTSTGYGPGGATLADVKLMREHSPPSVAVKAAGGVKTLDELLELRPYITRCGLSRTREILDDCRRRLGLARITSADGPIGDY